MKSGLKLGATAELQWQVSAEHVIHLGYPPPTFSTGFSTPAAATPPVTAVVFSTPNMILLMERAARRVLEPFLEPGEESVGAVVNVEHLAGAALGAEVRGVAKVIGIEGRAIDFEIAAYDPLEQIGRGTHRRVVVGLDRVARRIAEKSNSSPSSPETMPPSPKAMPSSSGTPATSLPSDLPQFETLRMEIQGALAVVTMNRPHKKNAVNMRMTHDWELLNAFLAAQTQIRIVIITGAGGDFCAGDDVPEVGTLSLAEAAELSYRQARAYLGWEQLPQVFIAAIDGVCLGAGCVVACACDLRIASHAARLGMPEVLLGWPPGYGIAQLTALVGKGRAMEMCLTGQPISAQQALQYGLVHRLVPSGMLLGEARKWSQELLRLAPAAVRETKRLLHADEGLQPKTAYLADTAAYIRCLAGSDAREGIAAFVEKRTPQFKKDERS